MAEARVGVRWGMMWVEIEINGAMIRLGPRWRPVMGVVHGMGGWCLGELLARTVEWEGVVLGSGRAAEPTASTIASLPAGVCPHLAEGLGREPWREELGRFRRWLQARVDYPGVECQQCMELAEDEGLEPDCSGCVLPEAPQWAGDVLRLWEVLKAIGGQAGQVVLGQALKGLAPGQAWVVVQALTELEGTVARTRDIRGS